MSNNKETEQVTKPRTSKLAVAAFVLGLLSIPTLTLTTLPALICALVSTLRIISSQKQLKGIGWILAGMIIPVFFIIPVSVYFFICFFQDAPPVPNDYTIADLYNAAPQYNASYELIRSSLTDDSDDPNGAPAIGLNKEDIDFLNELPAVSDLSKTSAREQIRNNTARIKDVWEKASKGRLVIEQLQNYPEIADLDEPKLEAKYIELNDLRYLERLYCYYAVTQLLDGKPREGINELQRMNHIARAMSVPSRGLIKKLVCYALFQMNIDTAALYINDPSLSEDMVELIANHFPPLTNEQVSLQNTMIYDHIVCRNEIQKLGFSRNPLFKYHSTVRLSRNYRDYWINQEKGLSEDKQYFNVWPDCFWFMPQVDPHCEEMYPWYYTAYNPIGSPFLSILNPALGNVYRIRTKIQIKDDLFHFILARRMGQEGSLKARAWGEKYIIDTEKKRIYSPGPDGEAFTKDDIWLTIDPNVLDLAAEEPQ